MVGTSILDHFMVDTELLKVVKDAGALNNLGDNLSRHSPIMIKLDLSNLPIKKKTEVVKKRKPALYKAREMECKNFKVGLKQKLQSKSK